MIGWLFEAGPVLSSGMGLAPLCDRDLVAWQQNQGITLTPWECITLIRLSRIYANGLSTYTDPKSAPPWAPPADPEAMRKATASRQEMMKRLASR